MRTRAAQKLQQQRLRLIVRVMRKGHEFGLRRAERCITRRAGLGLEAGSAAMFDAHAPDHERYVAARALSRAKRSPCVGVGGQAVMHMHCRQRDAMRSGKARERVEQRDGIAPTRKRDDDARGGAIVRTACERVGERSANGSEDRMIRIGGRAAPPALPSVVLPHGFRISRPGSP
jgi:hypothetical protein